MSYHQNVGYRHFCGYSAAEIRETQGLYDPVLSIPEVRTVESVTSGTFTGTEVSVRTRANLCEGIAGESYGRGSGGYYRLEAEEILPARPAGERLEGDEPMLLDRNGDGAPDVAVQVEYETAPPGGNEGAATRILVGTALQEKVTRTGVRGMTTVRAGNSGIGYDSLHRLPTLGDDVPGAAGAEGQFLYIYGRESRLEQQLPEGPCVVQGASVVWPTKFKRITSEWNAACRGATPWYARLPPGNCDIRFSSTRAQIENCVGQLRVHNGLDIRARPVGATVYAVRSGGVRDPNPNPTAVGTCATSGRWGLGGICRGGPDYN